MAQPITEHEADLVAPLLGFPPFARFWRQQRPKVRAPLVWAIELDLEADGSSSPQADGTTLIRLKRLPRTIEDAITVCHEVSHSLLDQQRWPGVGSFPGAPAEVRSLAARLNGLLDIEIDRRLASLGFHGDHLATIERVAPLIAGTGAPQFIAKARERYTTPAGLRALYRELLGALPAELHQWLIVEN